MRAEATVLAGILEFPGMAEIYTYRVLSRYFIGTEYGVEVEAVGSEG